MTGTTTQSIYSIISNDVLPTIADGATITFQYFLDLFGRYIIYYISINTVFLIVALLSFIVFFIQGRKATKRISLRYGYDWYKQGMIWLDGFVIVLCSIALGIALMRIIDYSHNIIRAAFIPEIVIYQELSNYTQTNDLNPLR